MAHADLNQKKHPKNKVKSVSPIALLMLTACGGDEEDAGQGLSFTLNENSTSLLVGNVSSSLENGSVSTYGVTGDDADSFEISEAGELSLKEAANYEAKDSYSITIDITTTTPSEVEGEEPEVATVSRDYMVNVLDVNDAAIGALIVNGTAVQGDVLTADTSGITDEDGIGIVSYQWYRDGELITGADDTELVLSQDDVGSVIRADISYVDGSGTTEEFTSANTTSVINTNDAPIGVPTVTGTLSQDREISVDTSSVSDADGLGDFSYQWNRDGVAIAGANGDTYTLNELDVGSAISVTVSYTDGFGAAESVESAETSAITKANDAPTGAVIISGIAAEGETLTLDTSSVADVDGVGTFSYVWMKDGSVIVGETGSTYTLTQTDVGSEFSASVSYVDGLGATETLSTDTSAAVVNVNDDPTGSLVISGSAEKGSTLTLDTSSIADEDGLGAFTITWLSDGVQITGAQSNTYTVAESDVGTSISAAIQYTDGQGTVESVSSASTATVADVIVESIGAINAVNTGSGSNMILEFYADESLVGSTVTSFDAVVTFNTTDASYRSVEIQDGYLGFPNANDGVINLSGISLGGGSSSDPLFTLILTDEDLANDLAVYVTDVLVNNDTLDGSTLLIG